MRKPKDRVVEVPTPKNPQLKAFSDIAAKFKSFRPAREVLRAVKAVPTIFPQIDHGTRVGGWPIERVAVVHGPSNMGKTIFCHGLGLSFLQRGHLYAFIDAEMTTPITWLEHLFGDYADNPKFMAMRPRTYEEAVDGVRELCGELVEMREKEIVAPETSALIVVDSIRKLIPKNLMARIEKDGASGDKGSVDGYGGRGAQYKAALNAAWLDELVPLMYHSSATIIFIAREAEDAEASINDRKYGNNWRMGGGKALEYDSSLVARISRAGFTKIGSDESSTVVGERHCVDIRKTKVAAKEDKTTRCYFHTSNGKTSPEGFDRARDVVELAIRFGVIEVSGSWHSWSGHKFQGLNKTLDKLYADKALLDELEVTTRAKFESTEPIVIDSDGAVQE